MASSEARRTQVKRLLKQLVDKGLAKGGFHLSRARYARDGLATIHNDHFRCDPGFQAAYRRGVEAGHGVDLEFEWRVHVALWAAKVSLRAPGDFVECGVNAGVISSAIMHRLDWRHLDRKFYLVDTWNGPPHNQYSEAEVGLGRRGLAEAALARGALVTDLDRVRGNFSEWPNAVIVQGAVPDILPAIPAVEVAFLHLDMNCAYPERAALDFFWERLSPGSMVLLDDYAYHGHEQQTIALDAAATAIGAEILSLPTGQGLIVK
jgi:hypothetical protein